MLVRIITLYASFSLAALPFTAAMAEAENNSAVNEARRIAKEVINKIEIPSPENVKDNIYKFGSGVNGTLNSDTNYIDIKTLFPGKSYGKQQSDFEALYNDDNLSSEAISRTQELKTEDSPAGEAFRTFDVSVQSNPRPDLTNDPIFKSTDLIHQFVDSKNIQCGDSGSHTPQLVSCRRPTDHPKYCTGKREVKVYHRNVYAYIGTKIPNHGTVRVQIDLINGSYSILPGSNVLEDTGNIPKLDANEFCKDNEKPHIIFAGSNPWIPPNITGTQDKTYDLWVEQQPTCDNGLVTIIKYKDIKGGQDIIVQGVQLLWDVYGISEDTWSWDRSNCPDDILTVQNGICPGMIECLDNPTNCITIDGITFCDDELQQPPANVPRACKHISVTKKCGVANIQTDECIRFERNGCAFIKSECISYDQSGKCLISEVTYDCGINSGSDAACQAAKSLDDIVQDCEVIETPITDTKEVHEPKYVTCEEMNSLPPCIISRNSKKNCLEEETDWTNVIWKCLSHGPVSNNSTPLYPGDDGSCLKAKAIYKPKKYNFGVGSCWVDPAGNKRCLENNIDSGAVPPPSSNCDVLDKDPSCELVDTRCVKGSEGYGGFCYVEEKRFDCGRDISVNYLTNYERTYNCPSPLQCMGESCLNYTEEYSDDFGKTAVMLHAAQQAQMDLNCDNSNQDINNSGQKPEEDNANPMNCRVFSGHHMECKKAVGGWQDCCIEPEGVNLANYIELIMAIGQLDSSIMALQGIEQLQGFELAQSFVGSWETLRTPVVNVWTEVTEPFTSAFNSVIANTVPEGAARNTVTNVVTKGPIDAAKDAILTAMQDWVNTYFPGASEFLFGEAAGGGTSAACGSGGCEGVASEVSQEAASEAGQAATEGAASGGLVGMIATVLNVVMIAYAIYAILNILVKIIWKCEMEEFQLGVQKQLRNCHYVGSYCKGFLCIEKRESYCCFNSPLARIINTQAKQQFGIERGDPKEPDCSGLSIEQLSDIDWNRIDLSEWLDILMVTGNFPTRNKRDPTIDNLTGSGNFLSIDENNPRPNLLDRTKERINPLTIDKIRSDATREIYP